MSVSSSIPAPASVSRNTIIAGGVVAFHVAALWAFQSGLLQRAVEVVVPVAIMTEFIEPPKPKQPPPSPPPAPKPVVRPKAIAPPPAPLPQAIVDPTPAPNAPVGTTEPPAPLPPIAAPVAPPAPPAPPPAPAAPPAPVVQLPSTNADYLQNPPPSYPAMSKRLGEQGKVLLRVLIGVDGLPKSVEVKRSSGFERLDRAALEAVRNWRFVPGKRNGVPETMAYDLPLNFVLN